MTTIVGKDAPLEDSIDRYRNNLKSLGLEVVESDWLNPLEHVFSVHLALSDCPAVYSNGKGASKLAALASAYGELFERLATHMEFADFYLGLDNSRAPFVHFPDERWTAIPEDDESTPLPQEVLNASLRRFYTKGTGVTLSHLVDLQSSSFSRGVCSVPFANARNGEVVYFPVNLLDNLYGSNGMSAGNTEYEALVQGLSEILERYAKKEIISKGLALPPVPQEIIERYPNCARTLHDLQGGGLKTVCYDASLGGKFPVLCVTLFNQSNGTCFASFGAHPIFEVALERTLTELMQGRSFSDLDNFEEPEFDLKRTSDPVNLSSHFTDSTGILPLQMFRREPDFRFVAWDFAGNTHDQYKALRYMIDKLGFDIYVRGYGALGVPVYRIVVPGMSEIYPLDDLVYNNTNAAIDFQEALLSLPDSEESVETYESYLKELEDEDLGNETLVCAVLGVLPDEDSPWATLRLGELKCLLALAAQQWNPALSYAAWTVNYNRGSFPLSRLKFYQCLMRVLECLTDAKLNENDYVEALESLYGEATVKQALAHVEGHERFCGLKGSDLNLKGFTTHQALLSVFTRIKEARLGEGEHD